MKLNRLLYIALISFAFIRCTDGFEELNVNPINPQDIQAELVFQRSLSRPYGGWEYQVGHNLFSNHYAQYVSNTKDGFKSDRYNIPNGWSNVIWETYFVHINPQYLYIKSVVADNESEQNKVDISRIWNVHQAQFVVDTYGDLPYFKAGLGEENLAYDSQKEIYYSFFEQLKTSVDNLQKQTKQVTYGAYDHMYNGNPEMWIKFANSLRLRYAIRISKVDPEKAKMEGEAALAADLISSNGENASLKVNRENVTGGHNFRAIADWNEFRASSTFIDILKNTSTIHDPRMKMFWAAPREKNADDSYKPIKGLDNGLEPSKLGNAVAECSNLGPAMIRDREYMVLSYSEVCFLKAEAALLGWSGAGDAQENYDKGVKASFSYWDNQLKEKTNAALLSHSVNKDLDYPILVDQYNELIETDALSQVDQYMTGGAQWNSSDTKEEKLRKIITQKYIANFPDGMESWCEFRRTGYPSEIKPIIDPEPGTVPQGQFIKRLKYVEAEYDYNKANVTASSVNKGKPDELTTPLWWDVD